MGLHKSQFGGPPTTMIPVLLEMRITTHGLIINGNCAASAKRAGWMIGLLPAGSDAGCSRGARSSVLINIGGDSAQPHNTVDWFNSSIEEDLFFFFFFFFHHLFSSCSRHRSLLFAPKIDLISLSYVLLKVSKSTFDF